MNKCVTDDRTLVMRAKRGEIQAFEQLVGRYKRKAYFVALSFVGNHEDALDISQDSFVKAFRSLKRFKVEFPFFPWFYTIVRNNCLNHLRRVRRRDERSLDELEESGFRALDTCAQPDEAAERTELRENVMKAIGQLEPHHREIIMLRHFQGMSYREMAETLGCPQGTVMSRLHSARQRLREMLEAAACHGG
jgi:RNA polymerase sigma-70 factor (ECF subfamily)